jgi:arsenite/tail-anchored protein-transporting ATPase
MLEDIRMAALQLHSPDLHPERLVGLAGDRRFYLLGGKGGVGKTTSAAALAVHLATQGVPTLVVSTDPAHSLSDSLDQDVSGGHPMPLQGTDLPIWGMQIDPEQAREELRELARGDGGSQVVETMRSVGLGAFAEQLEVPPPPK